LLSLYVVDKLLVQFLDCTHTILILTTMMNAILSIFSANKLKSRIILLM
jgi:hypothetical protein